MVRPGRSFVCRQLTSAGKTPPTEPQSVFERLRAKQPQLVQIAVAVGGGVTVYGISSVIYDMFFGFLSLTPRDMGLYGFAAGFATASLACGVGLAVNHGLTIRPEQVFRASLRTIQSDRVAINRLGEGIQSRGLRAYKIDGGHWSVQGVSPVWVPPRVQLIYDVAGERYDGLVTVEARKRMTGTDTTFIGLDVMNPKEERVLIDGDESRLYVKDQLRSLVSFKRTK